MYLPTEAKREPLRYRRRATRTRTASLGRSPRRRMRLKGDVEAPKPATFNSARQSVRLAALVFVQYALLAADVRFVASANYLGIAIANVCIATTTWYLTKEIVTARTLADRVCFAVGGAAGALLAVYLT